MGTAATVVRPEKAVATVALVGVDKATAAILTESFRLFGIQAVPLVGDEVARLEREKFHACALPLDAEAEGVLKRVRGSGSNRHIVIYGICSSLQEAMRYSRYGINAVFEHPVDRHAALRVVRFTYLLVVHELRRYVRVPLVSEALLETEAERLHASTVEISAGGMSLHSTSRFKVPQPVLVTFELPNVGQVSLRAIVSWMRQEEEMVGVRFEPADERRPAVRQWIDDYLEI
jgi:PilZ domain